MLGNQDAQQEYRETVYQALAQLGVSDPTQIPVKQMNCVGPFFAGIDISSFTAFGIWLDEEYLATCSEEERMFHIYHEACHYVSNHHAKNALGLALVGLSLIYAGTKLSGAIPSEQAILKYAVPMAAVCAAFATTCKFLLPPVVRMQEKEADIKAVQILMNIGKENVVDAHINEVSSSVTTEQTLWWYSNTEQRDYLKQAKKG